MEQDIKIKDELRNLISRDLLLKSEVVNRDLDRRIKLLFHSISTTGNEDSINQIVDYIFETYQYIHVMHGSYIFGVTEFGGMVLLINTESYQVNTEVKL